MQQKIISCVFVGLTVFVLVHIPAFAQQEESVAQLKQQIESLQKKVDQLEAQKKEAVDNLQPGISGGWDPVGEMNRMQQHMDEMFQSSFGQPGAKQGMFSSNMSFDSDFDLKTTDQGYEIKLDTTGFDKDKVDIQIKEHSITIKGEQSKQDKTESPDRYVSSQSFGSFMKTIPLPADADTTKATTEKMGNNIVIKMPKKGK